MKKITLFLLCGMFLFSCASSSNKTTVKDENAVLEETKTAAESAVREVHDLQIEKAKLEAEKSGK